MRLLWLAEDCRRAGLTVVEVAGWEKRGADFPGTPDTVVCHHTATPAKAKGDLPTQAILVKGRSDLPGPLCQVGLGRSGTVYVIAAGKANHAGKGAWAGTAESSRTVGIEAEHPGVGAWPDAQRAAYVKLVAVLLRGLGQTAERCCGHREWALPAGRKTDPNFDMTDFRRAVHAAMSTKPTTPPSEDEMTDADLAKIRAAFAEEVAKAIKVLHDDHIVILRGTSTGSHPNNLTEIGKAVGVKQP